MAGHAPLEPHLQGLMREEYNIHRLIVFFMSGKVCMPICLCIHRICQTGVSTQLSYACTNTYNFQDDYFLLIFAGSMKIRLIKKKHPKKFIHLRYSISNQIKTMIYVRINSINQNTIIHQC